MVEKKDQNQEETIERTPLEVAQLAFEGAHRAIQFINSAARRVLSAFVPADRRFTGISISSVDNEVRLCYKLLTNTKIQ